jgi:hypothetical protein
MVRACSRKKTLYRQAELKLGACTGDSEHVPLGATRGCCNLISNSVTNLNIANQLRIIGRSERWPIRSIAIQSEI